MYQVGPRFGQSAYDGDVAGLNRRTERPSVHSLDMLLQFRPAHKSISPCEHPLSIDQCECRGIGLTFESLDLRGGSDIPDTVFFEELLGLLAKLLEARSKG